MWRLGIDNTPEKPRYVAAKYAVCELAYVNGKGVGRSVEGGSGEPETRSEVGRPILVDAPGSATHSATSQVRRSVFGPKSYNNETVNV